ncbi:MAG: ABC transporter ATP-binding protein [Nitrospinota bacterium]
MNGPAPTLEVVAASKRFGGVQALSGCSIELKRGGVFGLIGPNGSGKTTLFNIITGIVRLDGGEIRYLGERIDRLPPHQIARRGIGRTFQIVRIFPELTCIENLVAVAPKGGGEARERARSLLDSVALAPLEDEYAGHLSFGQQKLLEFARVLMREPDLILLDEPAAGVNRTLLNQLLDQIAVLREAGRTIFVVEHDMKVVMRLCEEIIVLDHGEKIAQGPPTEIQNNPRVFEAYFGR